MEYKDKEKMDVGGMAKKAHEKFSGMKKTTKEDMCGYKKDNYAPKGFVPADKDK